jgi:hypothetical protein
LVSIDTEGGELARNPTTSRGAAFLADGLLLPVSLVGVGDPFCLFRGFPAFVVASHVLALDLPSRN